MDIMWKGKGFIERLHSRLTFKSLHCFCRVTSELFQSVKLHTRHEISLVGASYACVLSNLIL